MRTDDATVFGPGGTRTYGQPSGNYSSTNRGNFAARRIFGMIVDNSMISNGFLIRSSPPARPY
jgi:hypothetical protein